ncbi:protein-L-isoaspartate O-methyltransferase [Sphingomonas sp. HITSZ_GF]|uniref:protein-L-isoaspartate O-methyltransferase family protein n=1 Tax=Sphingomonas sp. HITSZ_GF TaxID=3037247 RepID=UPI00240D011E|nr:protein-L-isoaspartate O-methyltransferase [Sphingomonas sp. HITSZ_GF]MDG2532843.1 protein-L-isoaspartate O-methyltransferase [Sphingomonas sp. HITSZ_GF]
MALTVDFEAMRHSMVASQLRTNAVNDVRVVEAMAVLPREDFLPEAHRAIAYRDTLLPLAGGRRHNSPLATGRLLTVADLRPTDKVLLIGTAGGYTAALVAGLVTSVVAVEEEPALAALARTALAAYANVEPIEGPLAAGHAAEGPYDVLIVDGAVEKLPDALLAQLAPGARVVTGMVDRGVTRLATGRVTDGGFGLTDFADIECAVLPGFERLRTFQF